MSAPAAEDRTRVELRFRPNFRRVPGKFGVALMTREPIAAAFEFDGDDVAFAVVMRAARFLIQADVLPSLGAPIWDTSSWVSNSSIAGKVLQGLMGYDARPAGMQIAFFIAALVAIALGMAWSRRR